MTTQIRRYDLRPMTGDIIQPPPEVTDSAYRNLISANDHLHKVIKALIKERSGQPLTAAETHCIGLYIAAQRWQLQHTNKEKS